MAKKGKIMNKKSNKIKRADAAYAERLKEQFKQKESSDSSDSDSDTEEEKIDQNSEKMADGTIEAKAPTQLVVPAAATDDPEALSILKKEWVNRNRVLVLCSRGSSYKDRHLMQDLRDMLPHSKSESKMDKKQNLTLLNELAAMANCSRCVYFENRKRRDLYMWLSDISNGGPSAKFLVHNVHTAAELRLTGNCLKRSRPLLSFDKGFDTDVHLQLLKEMLTQTFSVPQHHPRSQPFIDHVLNFSLTPDGKIWFRNYQIVNDTAQLEEIGPRMVLELCKIFDGSFGGPVLYENTRYTNPNHVRRRMKEAQSMKYVNKVHDKKAFRIRKADTALMPSRDVVYDSVFDPDAAPSAAVQLKRILDKKTRRGGKKHKKVKLNSENEPGMD